MTDPVGDPPTWLVAVGSGVLGAATSYAWTVSALKVRIANLCGVIERYNIEHRALHAEIDRKIEEIRSKLGYHK